MNSSLYVIFSLLCFFAFTLAPAIANELAIANNAKSGSVSIPIQQLSSLNGLTQEQLYRMRKDAVGRYPSLLFDTYEPDDSIFGMCESRKPWWGIVGMEAYGPGQHATEGASKESNYILNPYRLVSAEVSNQINRGNRTELLTIWRPEALTAADKSNPNFPYVWPCGPVQFDPRASAASVTYNVSEFNRRVASLRNKLASSRPINKFSLIAYNARDFGFHYLYVDRHKSSGIRLWGSAEAVQINQFLHCGGSCGYPGGCNNMSPYIRLLDENELLTLPARVYCKLWKDYPNSVGDPGDFTFIIDLK